MLFGKLKEIDEAIQRQDALIRYYQSIKERFEVRYIALEKRVAIAQKNLQDFVELHDSCDDHIESARRKRSELEAERRLRSVKAGGLYKVERKTKNLSPEEKIKRLKAQIALLEKEVR